MWHFNGEPYTAIDNKRYLGFIYRIDNLTKSKSYLGQRTFYTRSGRYYKESDWQSYTGSSNALNHDIADGDEITKTILRFCVTKNEMNYHETKQILLHDALINDGFYNEWVKATITGKDCKKWSNKDGK